MRILQIFNRYAYVGGEELAVNQISDEIEQHHDLRSIIFESSEWSNAKGLVNRLKQAGLMVWNRNSINIVKKEISEFDPQIIIVHNIMPVGSAGLYIYLTSLDIPLVHFIHNFRPFSVNGYCWGDGRILPQGLKQNFIPEVISGSWQNSRLKTALYGIVLWTLHRLRTFKKIDGWIAVSNFMKQTFVQSGIDEDRIAVISHSWNPRCKHNGKRSDPDGDPTFLFLGRITEEKGLRVLLKSWKKFEDFSDQGNLIIAGDGPLADEIESQCTALKRAEFVGFKAGAEKNALLENCAALVVPSIWWEPLGLVLYEAYDYGKPVIAAKSGGILDHVQHGITGWLHEAGDIETLANHLLDAVRSPEIRAELGANGRKLVLNRSSEIWLEEFNQFIDKITTKSSSSRIISDNRSRFDKIQTIKEQIVLRVYLADQNPGHDRSFGISRMTHVILKSLDSSDRLYLEAISSKTSQKGPDSRGPNRVFAWGTRNKLVRFLTDHLHPLVLRNSSATDIFYFPKGYLPLLSAFCHPSVVTIHDTIIQYDEDNYPEWRDPWEYAYWAMMLKHTLRSADRILTVSESSRSQIQAFMNRHAIPAKDITVTYEPCMYESVPQPEGPIKENYVIHLASCEPHKMTAHLIRWWHEAEKAGKDLPMLHLIGTVPKEVSALLASSCSIVKRPFLEDAALQSAYLEAKALILPSVIEGFGLPALEAYYLGTPVCFVKGTSVEEILGVATNKGGFNLESLESLLSALSEVTAMSSQEVRECGLKLRSAYAASKVAERMMNVFQELKDQA